MMFAMKKLIIIVIALSIVSLIVFSVLFFAKSKSSNSTIQFFIEKELIVEFPVDSRRFYRQTNKNIYLILTKSEGLELLSATLKFSPKLGDLMEVRVAGCLMSSQKNRKTLEDFLSVLSSAFPPEVVSAHFDTSEKLESAIRQYDWKEEKNFSFDPLKRFPDIHPNSSLAGIELLQASLDLSEYLMQRRKEAFLRFMGYNEEEQVPQDKEYHKWIDYILSHHSRAENTSGLAMPSVGTWLE